MTLDRLPSLSEAVAAKPDELRDRLKTCGVTPLEFVLSLHEVGGKAAILEFAQAHQGLFYEAFVDAALGD